VDVVKRGKRRMAASAAVKSKPSRSDNSGGVRPAGFELAEIRQLIRLVQRTGIGELEVSSGGRTVRISAQGTASAVFPSPQVASTPAPAPAAPAATPEKADHLKAITSPMVGTFYRAPAPDADPYVEVGTSVEVGQTVCIIEAMKLMNEIESEVKGRIVQILVENAQPVEFGQKLFLVEPV
jgi:acetyl-CoA carboxylase biotin carboxyl carrier protein